MKKLIYIGLATIVTLAVGYVIWPSNSVLQSPLAKNATTSVVMGQSAGKSHMVKPQLATKSEINISGNPATNNARFVYSSPGKVLFISNPQFSPEANANAFLQQNGICWAYKIHRANSN